MSDEGSIKVTDSLREVYKKLDAVAEEVTKKAKTTCSKGCAHCCYLLPTITFTEGLLIAETLLSGADWREWLPKLREAAKKFDYVGITKRNYFDKGNPCVFLSADKYCSIYAERPAACRYHYVVSPPEKCSHLATKSTTTHILDMLPLEEHVWGLNKMVVDQLGRRDMMIAPLPLMVLACMLYISQGDPDHHLIVKACEGLRSPMRWVNECMESLFKEADEDERTRILTADYNKEHGR